MTKPVCTEHVDSRGKALILNRCPHCRSGRLYQKYLMLHEKCNICGFDFQKIIAGDGAAAFVIFFAGAITAILTLVSHFAFGMGAWGMLILWVISVTLLSFLLMPFFKTLIFHLEYTRIK